jgi:hypothetical protein
VVFMILYDTKLSFIQVRLPVRKSNRAERKRAGRRRGGLDPGGPGIARGTRLHSTPGRAAHGNLMAIEFSVAKQEKPGA